MSATTTMVLWFDATWRVTLLDRTPQGVADVVEMWRNASSSGDHVLDLRGITKRELIDLRRVTMITVEN